jgi:hypothetical protein
VRLGAVFIEPDPSLQLVLDARAGASRLYSQQVKCNSLAGREILARSSDSIWEPGRVGTSLNQGHPSVSPNRRFHQRSPARCFLAEGETVTHLVKRISFTSTDTISSSGSSRPSVSQRNARRLVGTLIPSASSTS